MQPQAQALEIRHGYNTNCVKSVEFENVYYFWITYVTNSIFNSQVFNPDESVCGPVLGPCAMELFSAQRHILTRKYSHKDIFI